MNAKVIALVVMASAVAACRPGQERESTPVPALPSEGAGSAPHVEFTPMRDRVATIAAIVAEPDAYAGKAVAVRGRCLGWRGPALGPQPRSRSDWQIGDDASALWVVGPFPPGCTGAAGGGEVTLRATVAVDTVSAALGSAERQARAYLVKFR